MIVDIGRNNFEWFVVAFVLFSIWHFLFSLSSQVCTFIFPLNRGLRRRKPSTRFPQPRLDQRYTQIICEQRVTSPVSGRLSRKIIYQHLFTVQMDSSSDIQFTCCRESMRELPERALWLKLEAACHLTPRESITLLSRQEGESEGDWAARGCSSSDQSLQRDTDIVLYTVVSAQLLQDEPGQCCGSEPKIKPINAGTECLQ